METTQTPTKETAAELTPADQKPKKRFSALHIPPKRRKWVRRVAILAVLTIGGYWFVSHSGQSGGPPAMGQYTPDTVQRQRRGDVHCPGRAVRPSGPKEL